MYVTMDYHIVCYTVSDNHRYVHLGLGTRLIGSRVITAGFVVFILLVVLYSLLSSLLDGVRECDELVALELVSVWLLQQPEQGRIQDLRGGGGGGGGGGQGDISARAWQDTSTTSKGVWCKLPHRGLGRSPSRFANFALLMSGRIVNHLLPDFPVVLNGITIDIRYPLNDPS